MSDIVSLEQVSKSFVVKGEEVHALRDIDLTIEQGEIHAIVGHSGAGKSTLVRLINGLEQATSGTITVNGTDISRMTEGQLLPVRRDIGMVFQQFNLFTSRSVAGNVGYPLRVAGWPKARRNTRIAELLDFVGLLDRAHSYPDQLSGGQKQRVGIARALATSPPILLADEATSALDPATTAEVLRLLKRVNTELGVTVVLITHEMDVVRSIADRVTVLSNGEVVEQGSSFDVFSAPRSDTAKSFVHSSLGDRPSAAELSRLRGAHSGRLFQVDVTDGSGIGEVLSGAGARGVSFDILYGGITSLQEKSFGSLTVELVGASDAVDATVASLRERTAIREVTA